MREQEDTQDEKSAGTKTPSEGDRFVAGCREVMLRKMPGLIDELFSKLDDALYDLADKAEGEHLYAVYFDAMRVFRRRRADILSAFLCNLNVTDVDATHDRPSPYGDEGRPVHDFEAANAELEEGLALKNLISKAENRYRGELFALRRHLAALASKEAIDSRSDPLGPYHICNAFRGALDPVQEVDLSIKLIVYKLFDKQVMDRLGRVYARCCHFATANGQGLDPPAASVVPFSAAERGRRGAVRDQVPVRSSHPDAAHRGADAHDASRSEAERSSVFHVFQRLLGRRKRLGSGVGHKEVVATPELMDTLSELSQLVNQDSDPAALRERLRRHLRLGEGAGARGLDPLDADTLELVLLLFEQLLQGADIPQPLKRLIGRLQLPTLQVALCDKSFFEDGEHPARRLLNHLAQVAIGWNDDGDRAQASLHGQIDRLIDRLVHGDGADPDLFAELDAELCDLLVREQEASHSQEVRAQQDLDLRERRHSAQVLVDETIERLVADKGPVPDAIAPLVYEGWRDVMLEGYLEKGPEGAPWQDAVATLDRLLWSMQPKTAAAERRELLRNIPEMLRNLRENLTAVSYDQRKLAKSLRELQALHVNALRGTGVEPNVRPRNRLGSRVFALRASRPFARPVKKSATAPANGKVVVLDGKEAATRTGGPQCGELGAGTWIEVRGEGGEVTRVKLAWRSPRTGICLFVDRRGQKALELTGEEIARLQREGTLTVVGNTPIVDRAMQNLVNTLKDDHDL